MIRWTKIKGWANASISLTRQTDRPTNNSNQRTQFRILGCRIDAVEIPDLIDTIVYWIESEPNEFHYIVNTGMHGLMEAHRNSGFKNVLNSADLFAPDGILTILVGRVKGARIRKSETGPGLLNRFLSFAENRCYRHYLYGDSEETLIKLSDKIEADYPNHLVVGSYSPPFRPLTLEEDETIIARINEAKPDILWVGLGTPKQERWIFDHRNRLNAPIAIGVGAAFKFTAGNVSRAPAWIGNLGFEWLWRLCLEPKRLWRRVFIDAPQFITLAILELIGLKRST